MIPASGSQFVTADLVAPPANGAHCCPVKVRQLVLAELNII
jgi:hypothetical protein